MANSYTNYLQANEAKGALVTRFQNEYPTIESQLGLAKQYGFDMTEETLNRSALAQKVYGYSGADYGAYDPNYKTQSMALANSLNAAKATNSGAAYNQSYLNSGSGGTDALSSALNNWASSLNQSSADQSSSIQQSLESWYTNFTELFNQTFNRNPTETELQDALAEAKTYYGYNPDTTYSPKGYSEAMGQLDTQYALTEREAVQYYQYQMDQLNLEKQNLVQDYQNYIAQLQAGEMAAGSQAQIAAAKALAEKENFLKQNEISFKQNMNALQRDWISKGALFSGVRAENEKDFANMNELEKQRYIKNAELAQQAASAQASAAMAEYSARRQSAAANLSQDQAKAALQESRYNELKQNEMEKIQLQKLQDMQSLQEQYQQAIAARAAQSLENYYTQ